MAVVATFDQAVYTPGDTMTLTVTTDPADRDRFAETPFVVDVSVPGVGAAAVTAMLRRQVDDALVSVSDPDRAWTLTSDDGTTAVFTATA